MTAALNRFEFAPPAPPGFLRAFGLAIAAHLVLVAALTWGVNWRHQAVEFTAEAELWAQVPVQAAPKLVEAPPPAPPVVEKPTPQAPPSIDPQIVTERDKRRLADEKKQQDATQARLQKEAASKKLEAQKKADEQKLADAAKLKQAQAKLEEQKLEMQRQENIKRMAGLAGATGSATTTGNAQQSAGPSSSYQGRIQARIYPNIVFTDEIAGNPVAVVEVRAAPDGTITGRKLVKSSGLAAWDEAVLKAIDKTEVLPRDIDGRVPSPLEIGFRPKK